MHLFKVLAGTLALSFSGMLVAGVALYIVELVQAQRDPGIKIESLDVSQVSVSTTDQLMVVLRMDVRKGCVGKVARGFVRPTPGVPDSMDIQILNSAPVPVGLSMDDISESGSSLSAAPVAINAQRHTITYRIFIPSPSNLERGGGWRFAEFLSQEPCGWLHGLLPVNTSVALGPPIELAGPK